MDTNNVVNLGVEKLARLVEEQTDINRENSNLISAIEDGYKLAEMIDYSCRKKANDLKKEGKEPYPCFNIVCDRNNNGSCLQEHECFDCLYQMTSSPPNSIDYIDNGYMPSHQEALDMLEKHKLLKGERQRYEDVFNDYQKPLSQRERNQTEVKGIKMCQVEECIEKVYKDFMNWLKTDGINEEIINEVLSYKLIIARNIAIELEKAMGIYPNIRPLK